MKYWMQNVHHSITIWNGYLKLADLARSVRTSRTYRTDGETYPLDLKLSSVMVKYMYFVY